MMNTTHEKMGRVAELMKELEKNYKLLAICDRQNISADFLVKKINRQAAELDRLTTY